MQPLRFQGQYFDAESGLHYNRHRYYSPDTARFITPDPIGLAGGLNQTQYVPNPTGWVDPLGLASVPGGCPPLGAGGNNQAGVKTGEPEIPVARTNITRGADVTPEVIQNALKGDTFQTVQGTVSLPAVQRYVDRLLKGDVAPPIKVDGSVIVEGNHRYVAGKVTGQLPEMTAGTLSPSNIPRIKPMNETKVDPTDWGNK